jgi:hypothetical protein
MGTQRLSGLVPPPRKHRHCYHGVFAPNHKLRRAFSALASGNISKRGDIPLIAFHPSRGRSGRS